MTAQLDQCAHSSGRCARGVGRGCPTRRCSAAYVLFPDPWPKLRHHKRRFIQTPDASANSRARFDPGGEFRLATDHMDYARWALLHLMSQTFVPLERPNVRPIGACGPTIGRRRATSRRRWRRGGRAFICALFAFDRGFCLGAGESARYISAYSPDKKRLLVRWLSSLSRSRKPFAYDHELFLCRHVSPNLNV